MDENVNFGMAILLLKDGRKVTRRGWNGKGMWLELQVPDAFSKMTLPYIYLNYPQDAQNTPGARVPWLASQTDMLAEDWMIATNVDANPYSPPHTPKVLTEADALADLNGTPRPSAANGV